MFQTGNVLKSEREKKKAKRQQGRGKEEITKFSAG